MGNSVRHAPGTFCWAELMTSDADGAKNFYTSLMGWEAHDDPLPSGGVYTMLRLDGGDVGALYRMMDDMRAQGVPPHWMPYVTVESAADAVKKVRKLGGSVIAEAFDVMQIGSMAVLQDPAGASFSVWQPKLHSGVDHVDDRPGTLCWSELMTNDVDKAGAFYAGLFGWRAEVTDAGPTPYTIFMNGDVKAGGMIQSTGAMEGIPPNWMLYFSTADCDASAGKAAELGGRTLLPPMDIPEVGRFSVLRDPQGAAFSVIHLSDPSG